MDEMAPRESTALMEQIEKLLSVAYASVNVLREQLWKLDYAGANMQRKLTEAHAAIMWFEQSFYEIKADIERAIGPRIN
jgi:hypothetical protein